MKRLWLVLIIVVLLSTSTFAEEKKKFEPEKFIVKYEIQYNSLSLYEAYAKEKEIKSRYDDACSIDIKIEEMNSYFIIQ